MDDGGEHLDDLIRLHAPRFDSPETLAVVPACERERGKPNWDKPYIQVIARRPEVLRPTLPDTLDGVSVRVIAATMEEQAARLLALRRTPGATRADVASDWRTGLIGALVEAPRDYSRLTYQPFRPSRLFGRRAPMEILLHVSPDHGWPALEAFLDPARDWVVAMYDFTAPHVVGRLRDAVRANDGRLSLCLGPHESLEGPTKVNDVSEADTVAAYRDRFGARFRFAW